MTELGAGDLLRGLVREVIADLVAESVGGQVAPPASAGLTVTARGSVVPGAGPAAAGPRVEDVSIASDADLQAFALRLLGMFENPAARQDVRAGRIRFRLANGTPSTPSTPTTGPVQRIERGAVTERAVRAAAKEGARLQLGPKAVLTPLARDQARRLGVQITKETAG